MVKLAGPAADARTIFERLHERARDEYDMDGQADLYAPDGILELPFAPPAVPHRIAGREAIRAFPGAAGERARQAGRRVVRYDPPIIRETADPEVIVAEFALHGAVAGTGTAYQLPSIRVLRVRGGPIVSLRDCFDPLALATALAGGRTPAGSCAAGAGGPADKSA